MESFDGGDDQGSGWLQVKKKHRNSSKFSLHGWVGGLSGKQGSRSLHTPSLPTVKNEENNKPSGQLLKSSLDTVVHDQGSFAGATSVLDEDQKNAPNRDIRVVNLDNECPRSPAATSVNVEALDHKPDQEQTKNSGVHFKIKWGDLDDDILSMHHKSSIGAERSINHIEEHELTDRKGTNGCDSLSNIPATGSEDNKLIAVVNEDHGPRESHSLPSTEKFVKENCKDVNEVLPEEVKSQITNENVRNQDDAVASCQEQFEFTKTDNDGNDNFSGKIDPSFEFEESVVKADNQNICNILGEKIISTANEEASMIQSRKPVVAYESGCSKISGAPLRDGESSQAISRAQVLRPIDESGPCSPGAYERADAGEAFKVQPDAVLDDLSESHTVDAVDVDGKGGGKERFRERLWCFLFENLNRALDELYLLCELECDLEQVKEAILVLEEAASDFRELNSRVKEFDKVKKSPSHLSGGAALTMKSDHRRPHALSWEVRRMTTSPHRAEILSSSLEVFRKIQEDRARLRADNTVLLGSNCHNPLCGGKNSSEVQTEAITCVKESLELSKRQSRVSDSTHGRLGKEKRTTDPSKIASKISKLPSKESSTAFPSGKNKKDLPGASSESGKLLPQRDKIVTENVNGRKPKLIDSLKRQTPSEREKEKITGNLWKSMDAWKEKRNWEDILASTHGASSRFSHSPGVSRRSAERARILHVKLMSPDKRKKSALDLKKEAEEKHARATRIRSELENEKLQKLQRASEKLNRVNEWQAVRSMKMREVIFDRQRRSVSRHEAFLAQVVRRAGDESSKVNEVRFITSLNEENKKLILRQKLQDSQLRRAEKLQMLKTKQKEDMAREEAVLERKRLIEAEKLQRLAETQRKKEEAQLRREEERKASTAAREAKAIEQMRRKEVRAKAQQEEAELLAQKLAEKLRESEQRRKFYLEQIRERASMDFRDQSSPLFRRSVNKDGQGRSTPNSNFDDFQANNSICSGGTSIPNTGELEHILKRRIKKIRQRLMALKYEFVESSVGSEYAGSGYRTAVANARAKICRWLQELQKLRQARKEGAANFGLITAEMIKFLDGKDAELRASRQAGLLDFIASALPASHTSKPEACQVTIYLLRLLKVVLSLPDNKGYFLSQNFLPPIIPMLVAAIENYIKIVASLNAPCPTNLTSGRNSTETFDSIAEILDGFLWTVAAVIGHEGSDEPQLRMQDGLLELVVAYKVIHRLRDLFALYDRPHVEGSPFPPSILLSIKLLAVLTSKCGNASSVDWDSFTCRKKQSNEKVAASVDLRSSPPCIFDGDKETQSLTPNCNLPLPLPDVPEEQPLDQSTPATRDENAMSLDKIPVEVESISPEDKIAGASDDFSSSLLGDSKCSVSLKDEKNSEQRRGLKQSLAFLLSSIAETGLVCLPSMLTAVLLQANNRLSSEQASYVLPSNFEEVATGVLKVFNNLAKIDMTFIQKILARSDLKMEFFHVMSFILSHCTNKWGAATDQNGLLLLESLSLLSYFALFHPENQAVLRWGKDRTILHKVCDLPFAFFSDPELMPVLAGTLVAACFGSEQNKGVVQQELSMDMLLSLLRSCRSTPPAVTPALDNPTAIDFAETNHVENPQRSHRGSVRSSRVQSQKGNALANSRSGKMRHQKDYKTSKLSEEIGMKQNQSAPHNSTASTLYSRFPESFINKAEQFFVEIP